MPEGDTVHRTARRLHEALAGATLTRAELRVPQLATVDLAGQAVTEVLPRGKHLLTRLSSGQTLHSHLRMDGAWRLFGRGRRWSGGPAHQIRAVLHTDAWTAVGYRLHDLALVATGEEHRLVGQLGPDLLGPDWDEAEAVRRLCADPAREVGSALLDQRNLAGVGNLYKSEACFLRGASPWLPVGEVADVTGLVRLCRRLLVANADRWEQSTTGNLRPGRDHWVFERTGQPCRRCGASIRTAAQGDPPYQRLSYWCPRCQPGPTP